MQKTKRLCQDCKTYPAEEYKINGKVRWLCKNCGTESDRFGADKPPEYFPGVKAVTCNQCGEEAEEWWEKITE